MFDIYRAQILEGKKLEGHLFCLFVCLKQIEWPGEKEGLKTNYISKI